jgi:hypothetical protein
MKKIYLLIAIILIYPNISYAEKWCIDSKTNSKFVTYSDTCGTMHQKIKKSEYEDPNYKWPKTKIKNLNKNLSEVYFCQRYTLGQKKPTDDLEISTYPNCFYGWEELSKDEFCSIDPYWNFCTNFIKNKNTTLTPIPKPKF